MSGSVGRRLTGTASRGFNSLLNHIQSQCSLTRTFSCSGSGSNTFFPPLNATSHTQIRGVNSAPECSSSRHSDGGVPVSGGLHGDSRFLVTGALGQIGLELVPYLRSRFGAENVIASDIKLPPHDFATSGPFRHADVREPESLATVIHEDRVTYVIHLASLLSASGEKSPQLALDVNIKSIQNVLELSRKFRLGVFAPSTIAVFGPSSPKENTPDTTVLEPTTIYGITKVHLELLGQYYRQVHGIDFRSLRYPGVISAQSMPGGGTTDYAVDIFHEALKNGTYTCFLEPDQALPMMYMPDCLKATFQLLTADPQALTRSVYNVTGMSFTPRQLSEEIKHHIPDFSIHYKPDFRQAIASTWPRSINDELARGDWGWNPSFDLEAMTSHMLHELAPKYGVVEEDQFVLSL